MTVLNYSYVVNFSRQKIWRLVVGFFHGRRYWDWIEKVEPLGSNPPQPGSMWRFRVMTRAEPVSVEVEITEWLEGERLALAPLGHSGCFDDIQLFQIIIDLEEKSAGQTRIKICCEYEPVSKWAKLKNLVFQRQRYLRLIEQSIDILSRVAKSEAEPEAPH